MKLFPTIVAGIFVGLGLIAVFIFATFSASSGGSAGSVTIWGSLPKDQVEQLLIAIQELDEEGGFSNVSYQEVPEEALVNSLVSAIASGKAPDAVLLPVSHLLSEKTKLQRIPYSFMSRRDFQDAYIEAGEVLLSSDGIWGLPLLADPLVMYWNRTLFANASVARPPQYWDDLATLAPALSKTTEGGTLTQSAVGLGTWDNIANAKAIFTTLLKQLGNDIVKETQDGYRSSLAERSSAIASGDSALRFYSEFADPVKPVYSWNRSQPTSYDAFLAGKVAIYFGRASELSRIRAANPNLNFDIARVPSVRGGGSDVETAMVAFVIPRGARNTEGALAVGQALTGAAIQETIETRFRIPSVRRDAVSDSAADPYRGMFRATALSSFVFPDPYPSRTDAIFKKMIEGVASGALTVAEAVSEGSAELEALLSGVQ